MKQKCVALRKLYLLLIELVLKGKAIYLKIYDGVKVSSLCFWWIYMASNCGTHAAFLVFSQHLCEMAKDIG